ncbi:MAG: helix-turn-helix domain-containing protein [Candidatus Adiutrix sp.]|nr:helix-turn-helix domain-containing protein [Candidatus Adiutrix sp.]
MPARIKTKTIGRFVEIDFHLKVAQNRFPLVSDALTAVLALAGHKIRPARPGRPDKPGKMKEKVSAEKVAAPETITDSPVSEAQADSPLRALRLSQGLSQRAMAEKLGLAQTDISTLETGKRALTRDMAKRIGKTFKTSYRALLK